MSEQEQSVVAHVRETMARLRSAPPAPSPRLDVALSPHLLDGTVVHDLVHGRVLIGTRTWEPVEQAGELARRIVRHGLADVLAGLGESVGPSPADPIPASTGREVLARLRALSS